MHIEDHRKVNSDNELRTLANVIMLFTFVPASILGLVLIFSNSAEVDDNVFVYVIPIFFFAFFLSILLKAFADVIYLLKKIADK